MLPPFLTIVNAAVLLIERYQKTLYRWQIQSSYFNATFCAQHHNVFEQYRSHLDSRWSCYYNEYNLGAGNIIMTP